MMLAIAEVGIHRNSPADSLVDNRHADTLR